MASQRQKRSTTKPSASRPSRERPQLLVADVDVILKSVGAKLAKQKKLRLLSDINSALDLYAREISNENQDTLNQFRKKFNSLLESVKRLRINLPSPGDRLFEAVRRHGEAYAKKHGPHRGVRERVLPPMNIEGLNLEEIDYRSGVLLRDLVEVVKQVERWISTYDEALSQRVGWHD